MDTGRLDSVPRFQREGTRKPVPAQHCRDVVQRAFPFGPRASVIGTLEISSAKEDLGPFSPIGGNCPLYRRLGREHDGLPLLLAIARILAIALSSQGKGSAGK